MPVFGSTFVFHAGPKFRNEGRIFDVWADLPRILLKNGTAKLRYFIQSIPRDPCVAKEVLFNIAGDCFGVTLGLLWLVV